MDFARFHQMRRAFERFPVEDAQLLLAFVADEALGNTVPFDPDMSLLLQGTRSGEADLPEMVDVLEYVLEMLPMSHPGKRAMLHASGLAGMADYVDEYREFAETNIFSTAESFISDLLWNVAPEEVLAFCGSLHRILEEKVSFHPAMAEKHEDCAENIENAWKSDDASMQQIIFAQSIETFTQTAELLGKGQIPDICHAAGRLLKTFQSPALEIAPDKKPRPAATPVPSHINALFLGLHALDIIASDKTCDDVLLAVNPAIHLSLRRAGRLGRILGRDGLTSLESEEISHLMEDIPATLEMVADGLRHAQNYTSDHLFSGLLDAYIVLASDAAFHIKPMINTTPDGPEETWRPAPPYEQNLALVMLGDTFLSHAMMNYPRRKPMPWTTLESLDAFGAKCETLDEKYENDEASVIPHVGPMISRLMKLSITMEKQLTKRGMRHESEICRTLAIQAFAAAQTGLLLEVPNWQERRTKTVSRFIGDEPGEVLKVTFRGKKRGNAPEI